MATPPQPSKQMSSRLLTMKFMQRAASSPNPSSERPPKKPRLSNGSTGSPQLAKPASRNITSQWNAAQRAIQEEERKKQQALDRAARDAGEERWVLSFTEEPKSTNNGTGLRIVKAGFAEIDAGLEKKEHIIVRQEGFADEDNRFARLVDGGEEESDDDHEDDQAHMIGRRSFGKFNKAVEKRNNPDYEPSSSDSSSERGSADEEDSDSQDGEMDPMDELIRTAAAERARAERKDKKRAAEEERKIEVERRRNKEVKLESEWHKQQ
ncbi:MAG: hypothetical protein M1820_010432 [Bogoriella megaspora]|nr:MAG: hypothetical protein M1820_010432 [Bogoriella megaspora]